MPRFIAGPTAEPYLTLIETQEITAATTVVTFSGLDGQTDGLYQLDYYWSHNQGATTVWLRLFPNGVTTNLGCRVVPGLSTESFNASEIRIAATSDVGSGGASEGTIRIQPRHTRGTSSGLARVFRVEGITFQENAAGAPNHNNTVGGWGDTSTNLTSLEIRGTAASPTTNITNSIGIGSTFSLYKINY